MNGQDYRSHLRADEKWVGVGWMQQRPPSVGSDPPNRWTVKGVRAGAQRWLLEVGTKGLGMQERQGAPI